MIEWKEYHLGELYDSSSGLSKGRKDFGFGYPFLTFKDVFSNYFVPDELNSLANTTERERGNCSIKQGDIFITRTSETQHELGMSAVALKDYPDATFNGFTKRLRMKVSSSENIYPKFIGYYFRSSEIRNQIYSFSTLTTRSSLNNSMLEKIKIRLPDYKEQQVIADTLFSIDQKIALNNAINKNLEEMAQALFKRWFVDFEFPNENGEPYKSSGGELVKSELGLIPKGWRVGQLSEIGEIVGGATPSKSKDEYYTNQGIPWITPKDLSINKNKYISKGQIDITELGFKNSSTKILPKGTVLFSSRAPIGYIAVSKKNITTNQGFKSIIPFDHIGSEFLYYVLKFNTEAIENRASGSTFKEISGGEMKQIPVIIPDYNTIEQFNNIVNPIGGLVEKGESENNSLIKLRDSLLPKLMSGEIRVPLDQEYDQSADLQMVAESKEQYTT